MSGALHIMICIYMQVC